MKRLLIAIVILLAASIANASTYWVRPTGTMSGCTPSASAPGADSGYRPTITAGMGCLASGDTLNIRTGTYSEDLAGVLSTSQSGTSYGAATIIQAYSTEIVTINGRIALSTPGSGLEYQYFIFKNLKIDGGGASDSNYAISLGGAAGGGTVHHIKLDTIEVTGVGFGMYLGGNGATGHDLWVTNAKVHDGGLDHHHHCFYIEGSNNTIENSECYNWTGFGIHNYGDTAPSNNIYRNNWIHETGTTPNGSICGGILLTGGDNNQAYNNIVSNNQEGFDVRTSANLIYNNTLYGNGIGYGGACCYAAMHINGGTGNIVKNNIIFGNQENSIDITGSAGTMATNNLCSATGQGCDLVGNPDFVNAAGNNFNLQASSTNAINKGATLSIVTTDFAGVSRPQGIAYDIGAYEYAQASLTPGILQFSSPTYSVSESGTNAIITVTRAGGSSGIVGATVSTSNGTASSTTDYDATSVAVSFDDGSITAQTVSIPITDDADVEGNETVNVALSAPTGGAKIGSPSTAILTIIDNDTPVVSGIVGLWTFNEASGTATDTSGQSNTVTLANGATRVAGIAGNALSLDGVDDYASAADSNSLDISSTFTILGWFRPSAVMTDFKSGVVKNYTYYLYPGTPSSFCGGPAGGFNSGGDIVACSPTPIPASPAWTLLGITCDGSTLRLYQNAVPVATRSVQCAVPVSSGTLQIGASEWGENFGGQIDDVRIYNTALTQGEILSIYNSVGVGSLAAPSNLIVK